MSSSKVQRPWWCRGGMHLNIPCMGLAYAGVCGFLLWTQDSSAVTPQRYALWLALAVVVSVASGARTVFVAILVPNSMVSLSLAWTLPNHDNHWWMPFVWIACALLLANLISTVCTSVSLHRYAGHAAFKPNNELVKVAFGVLACMGFQGGPLWWGSHHRAHHKYSDVVGDPHSPAIDGEQEAFGFFMKLKHVAVNEECCPPHLDCTWMRILDTFAFAVVWIEYLLVYFGFGKTGLFVLYTALWIALDHVLWVNVAFHELHTHNDDKQEPRRTTTAMARSTQRTAATNCIPLLIIHHLIYPIMIKGSGEHDHDHHHRHPLLACRDPRDNGYFYFLQPLEKLGLITIPPANIYMGAPDGTKNQPYKKVE